MNASLTGMTELHPDDLADLRRGGLSDSTIASMNCTSAEAETIRMRTGVQKVASGGYSIPYPGLIDQTGQPCERWRLRSPTDGMRYVSGIGDDPQHYLPPGLAALPSADLLVVTEGEKKSAKAVQEGAHCVGIQGVGNGFDAEGRAIEKVDGGRVNEDSAPLAALITVAKKYKHVLVLGDSDLIHNCQARSGFELLTKAASELREECSEPVDECTSLISPAEFLSLRESFSRGRRFVTD